MSLRVPEVGDLVVHVEIDNMYPSCLGIITADDPDKFRIRFWEGDSSYDKSKVVSLFSVPESERGKPISEIIEAYWPNILATAINKMIAYSGANRLHNAMLESAISALH